jgi:hypothetical protein
MVFILPFFLSHSHAHALFFFESMKPNTYKVDFQTESVTMADN